jgi:hypothetical protein
MRRSCLSFAGVTLGVVIAATIAVPAGARNACPFWISVSREGFPGEENARICGVGKVVSWLRALPNAEVLRETPHGALNDGFTVTIVTGYGPNEVLPIPPRRGSVLLAERVYPVADIGPVAFVPSRSVFRDPRGPLWVVPSGWRALVPTEPVPAVLTRLGMLQPNATGPTPVPSASPTVPTGAPSRPHADVVTVLFLTALVVAVGLAVRRGRSRTRRRSNAGTDAEHEASLDD